MTHRYQYFGHVLLSDTELPGLVESEGDATADIRFRLDRTPSRLDPATGRGPLFEADGSRAFLMTLPGVGRVLVRDGREIVFEPSADASDVDVRAALSGPIQAMLWHQRGLLPLHASAVAVAGGAVALAGISGAGKSTAAAALAGRGAPLVSDDLTLIDARSDPPCVHPGGATLRLWRDSLAELGVDGDGLDQALAGKPKYLLPVPAYAASNVSATLPMRAILVLVRQPIDTVRVVRLTAQQLMGTLVDTVHMRRGFEASGLGPAVFGQLAAIARSGLGVWRIEAPNDLSRLREVADHILEVAG